MRIPEEVLSFLRKEKKFLIAIHVNPDGDAIGSALALSSALASLGKDAVVYSKDRIPRHYRFLPGSDRIVNSLRGLRESGRVLVLIDCNDPERAAVIPKGFRSALVIDHHETGRDFGNVRWVTPGAAATGLMIYRLIRSLEVPVSGDIATHLYTAISVDTGTFRYSNTSAGVLRVGAELIEAGALPELVADRIYETWRKKRFDLLVMVLNTLEIKRGVAMTSVTREMYKKTGTGAEDTENFSNFPRMIEDVTMSALFRELRGAIWKVSLRSKGYFNVARIAEHFGGGGHKNAAGYKIRCDLASAKQSLLEVVSSMKQGAR